MKLNYILFIGLFITFTYSFAGIGDNSGPFDSGSNNTNSNNSNTLPSNSNFGSSTFGTGNSGEEQIMGNPGQPPSVPLDNKMLLILLFAGGILGFKKITKFRFNVLLKQ